MKDGPEPIHAEFREKLNMVAQPTNFLAIFHSLKKTCVSGMPATIPQAEESKGIYP